MRGWVLLVGELAVARGGVAGMDTEDSNKRK
jgi:hypothetical protein